MCTKQVPASWHRRIVFAIPIWDPFNSDQHQRRSTKNWRNIKANMETLTRGLSRGASPSRPNTHGIATVTITMLTLTTLRRNIANSNRRCGAYASYRVATSNAAMALNGSIVAANDTLTPTKASVAVLRASHQITRILAPE